MAKLAELTAGTLIGERYELGEQIGRGGMGAVYRAKQVAMDTVVALKFVDESVSREAVSRFGQEAKALAALKHPNIVRVLAIDMDRATERCYMAMELVEGISLDDFLERNGVLSPEQFRSFFTQIADALGYAHSRGIVHRDIKPSNILICSDNVTVKIVDFGLAKILEREQSITATGAILGTPHYMSPEQCGKGMIDGRTDIYALGCVMWRTLTNEYPFASDSNWAVLCKQMSETLPPVAEPRFADFAGVIARATEKDPNKRYQTMDELKQAIIKGECLPTTATTAGARAQKRKHFPKTMAVVAGALAVSLIGTLAILSLMQKQSQPTRVEEHLTGQVDRLLANPSWRPTDADLRTFAEAAQRHPQASGEDAARVYMRAGMDELAKPYLQDALSGPRYWHISSMHQEIGHFEEKGEYAFAAGLWHQMSEWKSDPSVYANEEADWRKAGKEEKASLAHKRMLLYQEMDPQKARIDRMLQLVHKEVVLDHPRPPREAAMTPADVDDKLKDLDYLPTQHDVSIVERQAKDRKDAESYLLLALVYARLGDFTQSAKNVDVAKSLDAKAHGSWFTRLEVEVKRRASPEDEKLMLPKIRSRFGWGF